MKKHFLLLLMAFFSLTGWAQTVKPSNVVINFSPAKYGGGAPNMEVSYEGNVRQVNGEGADFTWDEKYYTNEACTTEAEALTVSANYYYTKVVGADGTIFQGVEKVGYFKVEPADLTITAIAGLTKTYDGQPLNTTIASIDDITFEGFVGEEGAEDLTVASTGISFVYGNYTDADEYAVTAVNGISSPNYNILIDEAVVATIEALEFDDNFTVTAAEGVTYSGAALTQDALNALFTVVYTDPETEAETTLVAGTDFTVANAGEGDIKNAGNYVITITGAGNYGGELESALEIGQAILAVRAANKTIEYTSAVYDVVPYDAEDEPFVFSGFLGDDNKAENQEALIAELEGLVAAPQPNTEGGVVKDAGAYVIKVTTGEAELQNYTLTSVNTGKLTINPKPIIIKADNKESAYGEDLVELTFAAGYYTTEGEGDEVQQIWNALENAEVFTPNGEEALNVPTLVKADGTAVGPYDITFATRGEVSTNYTASYIPGTYTITAAGNIILIVSNQKKTYGDAEDPIDWENPGEEDYTVVGGELTGVKLVAPVDEEGNPVVNAGNYTIGATYEGYDDESFTGVTVVPGTLTIEPKPLTVKVQGQTLKLGDTEDALNPNGVTVTGLVAGDNIEDIITLAFNTEDEGDPVLVSEEEGHVGELIEGDDERWAEGWTSVDYWSGIKASVNEEATNYSIDYENSFIWGKLTVVDGTATIILNRVAKADFDTEANDAADVIAAAAVADENEDENIDQFNVTFSDFPMLAEKWYPMVLPFDTYVSEISNNFNYAVVNVLNTENTNKSKIAFKLHMGKIEANTPFVVKVTGENVWNDPEQTDFSLNMNNVFFWHKTIIAPEDYEAVEIEDASGVKFIGTYTGKIDGFRSNEYYFSTSADFNEYYKGNDTNKTYLRPLGAYFQVPAGEAGARVFEFEEPDGTKTAINVVKSNVETMGTEGWYTIGGMKLQNAPAQKGVYIQNGKKVVIK